MRRKSLTVFSHISIPDGDGEGRIRALRRHDFEMTEPGAGLYTPVKKRKYPIALRGYALYLLLSVLVVGSDVAGESSERGWEEGDDAVNVISVENMDALLGLRMVAELKSFDTVSLNETVFRFLENFANQTGEIKQDDATGNETEPEVKPDEDDKSNKTKIEVREKRQVYTQKLIPISSHVLELCPGLYCHCVVSFNGYLNISCDFQDQEVSEI